MSEWWDRYLFDDLIGLEAAAVTSDGSRHIGPFVRFGDYLTVDDTCVFTRKDKGDGVRLMEEVDHVRLRPEEPFWQGRFLDELEGVRVRVEFGGRRGAFEGPLEPFDGVLGIRAGGVERHTPADNTGERYDPRMEETRNSGRIESHPDIARLYEQFAHETAHAIRGEVEGPYVMDLYLDDAGQPHVIELNPQSNSGLYALDMDALLTAIRDNPEQFMPDPSRGGMPGCLGVREEDSICFFQIPTGNH